MRGRPAGRLPAGVRAIAGLDGTAQCQQADLVMGDKAARGRQQGEDACSMIGEKPVGGFERREGGGCVPMTEHALKPRRHQSDGAGGFDDPLSQRPEHEGVRRAEAVDGHERRIAPTGRAHAALRSSAHVGSHGEAHVIENGSRGAVSPSSVRCTPEMTPGSASARAASSRAPHIRQNAPTSASSSASAQVI